MSNILLLGRSRERVATVRSLLRLDGHHVVVHKSPVDWREAESEIAPDLVVAAVPSPDEILAGAGRTGRGFPAPLLLVQSESDFQREVDLAGRLVDRISSPFMERELLARVDALIRVRRVILRDPVARDEDALPERPAAGWRGLGRRIGAALGTRVPRMDKPLGPYLEVAARVAEWADRRDAFAPGHAERVTSLCAMIADGLRMSDHETTLLLRAAMLHDIGKVAIPVEMLHHQGPLADNQMRLMRTHPRRGASLLRALDRDDEVATTVLLHHEQPDGRGYYGTPADSIPRTAHALAVAEVYDAMTSSRVRDTLSSREALDRLSEMKGDTFDGDCVEALVDKLRPRPRTLPLTPMH